MNVGSKSKSNNHHTSAELSDLPFGLVTTSRHNCDSQIAGKMSLDDVHMLFVEERKRKNLAEKKYRNAETRVQMLEMVSEPRCGWYRHGAIRFRCSYE
eukprot:1195075-Prorocentrum_minimum.AAC.2